MDLTVLVGNNKVLNNACIRLVNVHNSGLVMNDYYDYSHLLLLQALPLPCNSTG
jgi:hypothetical protein